MKRKLVSLSVAFFALTAFGLGLETNKIVNISKGKLLTEAIMEVEFPIASVDFSTTKVTEGIDKITVDVEAVLNGGAHVCKVETVFTKNGVMSDFSKVLPSTLCSDVP